MDAIVLFYIIVVALTFAETIAAEVILYPQLVGLRTTCSFVSIIAIPTYRHR